MSHSDHLLWDGCSQKETSPTLWTMGRIRVMPSRCSGISKMAFVEWLRLERRADGSFFISNHLGTSVPKALLTAPGSSPPPRALLWVLFTPFPSRGSTGVGCYRVGFRSPALLPLGALNREQPHRAGCGEARGAAKT